MSYRIPGFLKLWLTILLGLLIICLTGFDKSRTGDEEDLPRRSSVAEISRDKPKAYSYKIIKKIKSDPDAFTQGFIVHNGFFFLGTGGSRSSSEITGRQSFILKMDMETGDILFKQPLNTRYFGEGITILNDRLYQLTWKNRTAFVYPVKNLDTKKPSRVFTYPTQGWGLTHDGKRMIMSDGTANLYFIDPETFRVKRRLPVRDRGKPIAYLNELEFVEGEVFANIYRKNRVARICPDTGRVTGWIDLKGLRESPAKYPGQDVLNGIAYDRKDRKLYFTGKLWEHIYEVTLIEMPAESPPGNTQN